jgi:hypothetical protein
VENSPALFLNDKLSSMPPFDLNTPIHSIYTHGFKNGFIAGMNAVFLLDKAVSKHMPQIDF